MSIPCKMRLEYDTLETYRILQQLFRISLSEQEQINAFNYHCGSHYSNADFRRNIVTENINLNALVEKEFFIGNVKLKGIKLCDPCVYLAQRLGQDVIKHMMHKAGLRAQILISGKIAPNDLITIIQNNHKEIL